MYRHDLSESIPPDASPEQEEGSTAIPNKQSTKNTRPQTPRSPPRLQVPPSPRMTRRQLTRSPRLLQSPVLPHLPLAYQNLEAFRSQILQTPQNMQFSQAQSPSFSQDLGQYTTSPHGLGNCYNSPFFATSLASTGHNSFTPSAGITPRFVPREPVDIFDPSVTFEEAIAASRQSNTINFLANGASLTSIKDPMGPPPLPTRRNTPVPPPSMSPYYQNTLPPDHDPNRAFYVSRSPVNDSMAFSSNGVNTASTPIQLPSINAGIMYDGGDTRPNTPVNSNSGRSSAATFHSTPVGVQGEHEGEPYSTFPTPPAAAPTMYAYQYHPSDALPTGGAWENPETITHTSFSQVVVHTAKCDICGSRNGNVLQRCDICNKQFDFKCRYEVFEDGLHKPNLTVLDWKPHHKPNAKVRPNFEKNMTVTRRKEPEIQESKLSPAERIKLAMATPISFTGRVPWEDELKSPSPPPSEEIKDFQAHTEGKRNKARKIREKEATKEDLRADATDNQEVDVTTADPQATQSRQSKRKLAPLRRRTESEQFDEEARAARAATAVWPQDDADDSDGGASLDQENDDAVSVDGENDGGASLEEESQETDAEDSVKEETDAEPTLKEDTDADDSSSEESDGGASLDDTDADADAEADMIE